MPTCVADAGPLIALAKIERFHLLRQLFDKVVVPQAVWNEVVVSGEGRPASDQAVAAQEQGWLVRRFVEDALAVDILRSTLGAGESQAIVLAQQLAADWLLLDDDLARSEAANLGVRVKGTVGVLLAADAADLLEDIQVDLDRLRARGVWLSDRVCDAVVEMARAKTRGSA